MFHCALQLFQRQTFDLIFIHSFMKANSRHATISSEKYNGMYKELKQSLTSSPEPINFDFLHIIFHKLHACATTYKNGRKPLKKMSCPILLNKYYNNNNNKRYWIETLVTHLLLNNNVRIWIWHNMYFNNVMCVLIHNNLKINEHTF